MDTLNLDDTVSLVSSVTTNLHNLLIIGLTYLW